MPRRITSQTPLQSAFSPYLDEVRLCACPKCLAAGECRQRAELTGSQEDWVSYRLAISDQLRALVEGRHVRTEWKDYAASLPESGAAPLMDYDVGRDGGLYGTGLGVSRRIF